MTGRQPCLDTAAVLMLTDLAHWADSVGEMLCFGYSHARKGWFLTIAGLSWTDTDANVVVASAHADRRAADRDGVMSR